MPCVQIGNLKIFDCCIYKKMFQIFLMHIPDIYVFKKVKIFSLPWLQSLAVVARGIQTVLDLVPRDSNCLPRSYRNLDTWVNFWERNINKRTISMIADILEALKKLLGHFFGSWCTGREGLNILIPTGSLWKVFRIFNYFHAYCRRGISGTESNPCPFGHTL